MAIPEYVFDKWPPEQFRSSPRWRAFAHRVGMDSRYPALIEGVGDSAQEALDALPARVTDLTSRACLCKCCDHHGMTP